MKTPDEPDMPVTSRYLGYQFWRAARRSIIDEHHFSLYTQQRRFYAPDEFAHIASFVKYRNDNAKFDRAERHAKFELAVKYVLHSYLPNLSVGRMSNRDWLMKGLRAQIPGP